MVSFLRPVPALAERDQTRQNLALQTLFKATNYLPSSIVIGGVYSLVDLNSANTDYPITIGSPSPFYYLYGALVKNNGTTASLTAATAGIFTAAAGGGTAIALDQPLSDITSNTVNTQGNMKFLTFSSNARQWQNRATLYFRVGTAQGAAATADVYLYIHPLP